MKQMDITPKMRLFGSQAHGAYGMDSHQWFLHSGRLSADALGAIGWTIGYTRPGVGIFGRYHWKVC